MSPHANIGLIEEVSGLLREALGDDFDPDTFWDTLDGETDALDLIGALIREKVEAEAHVEAAKSVIETYTARKRRQEDRIGAVKQALARVLDATGEGKVKHVLGTVSRTKPRERLEITEPASIPSQLCKRIPDSAAIKKALEQGEIVPGAEMVLGEPGLMVRVS